MKVERYTEEQKKAILQIGINYPENLRKGFRILAEKFNKSVDAISTEYYYLKKKDKSNYSFMLVSQKKVIVDRKQVRKGCPVKAEKNTKSIWNKLINSIKQLNKWFS